MLTYEMDITLPLSQQVFFLRKYSLNIQTLLLLKKIKSAGTVASSSSATGRVLSEILYMISEQAVML